MNKDSAFKISQKGDNFFVELFTREQGATRLLNIFGPFSKTEADHFIKMPRRKRSKYQKRLLINKIKAGPCLDCGETKASTSMTYDHFQGEKEFNIGSGARRTWKQLKTELEKCEPVCRDCHNIREYLRGRNNIGIEDLAELLSRYI